MSRSVLTRFLVAVALSSMAVTACGPKPPTETPALASDPDATRAGAVAIPLGKPATDDINFNAGDRADWKKVTVDRPGVLVVEVRWDNVEANLDVEVFDPLGRPVGASAATGGDSNVKRLTVPAESAGVYCVKVEAKKASDTTTYTVLARLDQMGGDAPATSVGPRPTTAAGAPDAGVPVEPVDKPEVVEKDREEVQGRIVSSYPEGGALMLQLDKGTASGIAVGDHGAILRGPSGDDKLEGGDFTITQVVDRSKSVGKCKSKPAGKHVRVVIYPGSAK